MSAILRYRVKQGSVSKRAQSKFRFSCALPALSADFLPAAVWCNYLFRTRRRRTQSYLVRRMANDW